MFSAQRDLSLEDVKDRAKRPKRSPNQDPNPIPSPGCRAGTDPRREVFEQATSIDEDGKAAEESVEQGLLVAGTRAINPPEAKYAEDESSQDGQLP
jgi:hypothetical protein